MIKEPIIEFKTTQIQAFKISCEVIDSLVSDVNFEFNADGFQIKDIDKTSKIFCFVKFLAENFDSYVYNFKMPKFDIGIDIGSIVNCLKPNLSYDELKLSVYGSKENSGVYQVVIRLENHQRKEVKVYNVTTIPSSPNINTIKELVHTHCVTLQSEMLAKYCKDINRNSSKIKISINKDKVTFEADNFVYTINKDGKGVSIVTSKDTTASTTLNIKYFMTFIKCSKLSEDVSLYMNEDKPKGGQSTNEGAAGMPSDIFPTIVYNLASLGTLKLVFL
jgi:hypothetical protein